MSEVFQSHLPISPWAETATARLPGIQPLDPQDWIRIDDAYAGQMALRDTLLADRQSEVFQTSKTASEASVEVLEHVLDAIRPLPGFHVQSDHVRRPDGERISLEQCDPLLTAGRLVQDDLCIMQKIGDEFVLTAAVLCFPASWTLSEKFMRPMTGIHGVVPVYDADIARRVHRLFTAIRPGRPLWRGNAHFYDESELYSPRKETDPRVPVKHPAPYVRSERQCLLRMPKSDAVLFSIHTYMVRQENLTSQQAKTIAAHKPNEKVEG